jgi:hypothetical protein
LDDGQQSWFEPLGDYDIEVDDEISGDLWTLGGEDLVNKTKDYTMSVFMEGHT